MWTEEYGKKAHPTEGELKINLIFQFILSFQKFFFWVVIRGSFCWANKKYYELIKIEVNP
jgi:hypothetical protein